VICELFSSHSLLSSPYLPSLPHPRPVRGEKKNVLVSIKRFGGISPSFNISPPF